MTPLRFLLSHLIDYAGLFPPAGLPMETAVKNYSGYWNSDHSWMLGRFVVPATRLAEFENACCQLGVGDGWKIAVLGMPDPPWPSSRATVDAIELKAEGPQAIDEASEPPASAVTYFEIPITRDPSDFLAALARAGKNAKIRTGGLTAEMFPSSADLARFLVGSASNHVPFKATAGLHHPVRSVQRFTYDADSLSGLMHGFVNVTLAAALVFSGGAQQQAEKTLEETSPQAFDFGDQYVQWHDHQLQAEQIRLSREQFMVSFGSCSFEEPLQDLAALGWL